MNKNKRNRAEKPKSKGPTHAVAAVAYGSAGVPSLEQLSKEVFQLVEQDQGYGFVPESVAYQHRDHEQFFARVRSWEKHTRSAADKLRRFLKRHGEY